MDPAFDVQRRSALTPEGQVEQAGHLARGVVRRVGRERVGRLLLAASIVCIVVGMLGATI